MSACTSTNPFCAGTAPEVINKALNELKLGSRSMLKIYLRGKQMRELRVQGIDDTCKVCSTPDSSTNGSVTDSSADGSVTDSSADGSVPGSSTDGSVGPVQPPDSEPSTPKPESKAGENEILTEAWCQEHLLPTIDHVCVFVLALKTAEMGYGMSRKFVYIQWIGQHVPMFPRSRALEADAALVNLCSSVLQLSGIMQAVKPEEITLATVLEKITGSKLRVATTLPEKLLNSGGLSAKNALRFDEELEILRAIDQLVDITNPVAWIILGYKSESLDVLELVATGTELIAMEGFKALLVPSKSLFVVQQVKWTTDRDMRGLIETERIDRDKEGIHYGLLHWVGSEVGLVERALSSHHWDAFTKLVSTHLAIKGMSIQGGHLQATEADDVTFEEIRMAMRLYD